MKSGSKAEADAPRKGSEPAWRQRAVSRSLSAARSRAEQRVQRFLDAAFELIDERGTTEFTIQEVVERAEQSVRGFYQCFDGKDELLLALCEENTRESLEDIREVVEARPDELTELITVTLAALIVAEDGTLSQESIDEWNVPRNMPLHAATPEEIHAEAGIVAVLAPGATPGALARESAAPSGQAAAMRAGRLTTVSRRAASVASSRNSVGVSVAVASPQLTAWRAGSSRTDVPGSGEAVPAHPVGGADHRKLVAEPRHEAVRGQRRVADPVGHAQLLHGRAHEVGPRGGEPADQRQRNVSLSRADLRGHGGRIAPSAIGVQHEHHRNSEIRRRLASDAR